MPYDPVNYTRRYPEELQTAWANILAFAWQTPEFLDLLRQDPKETIETYACRENEPVQPHCVVILEQGEGVFGIPNPPERLGELNPEQLASLLARDGLFGIIRGT